LSSTTAAYRRPRLRRRIPSPRHLHISPKLIAVAVAVGAVATTGGGDRDADLGWHLLLGADLLDGRSLADAGADWTTLPADPTWRSMQWCAELVLASFERALGELGPTAFRCLTTAGALLSLLLAVGLHHRLPPAGQPRSEPLDRRWDALRRWGPLVPFGCGVWVLIGFSQERPQQISLVVLPAAGWLGAKLQAREWLPSLSRLGYLRLLAVVAAVGLVWVNCHQGALFGAAAVASCALARRTGLRRRLALAVAVVVACWASPAGPGIWLTPGRLATAAGSLAEWQPVPLWTVPAWGSLVLVVGFVSGWLIGGTRPTGPESMLLACLGVLAAMAGRNLAFTVLFSAPLLAAALRRATEGRARAGTASCGSAADRALPTVAAGLTVILAACAVIATQSARSSPGADLIRRVVCDRQVSEGRSLVLATTYNEIGASLFAARRAPCPRADSVRVPLDGRVDRYAVGTIESWLDVTRARGRWRPILAASAANLAVLPVDAPLVGALRRNGWLIVDHGGEHIALVAPEDS
jgi:hypothetical protein